MLHDTCYILPKASNVPKKTADLIKEIGELSVVELAELVKALEEKFGVSAAPVAVSAAPPAAPTTEATSPAEGGEKSTFNVELSSVPAESKIPVIKALRGINQALGLKEAKDIAENPPKVILEGVKKEEAEEAKKKLESAGAKVELK